jgi:hypothetical protein
MKSEPEMGATVRNFKSFERNAGVVQRLLDSLGHIARRFLDRSAQRPGLATDNSSTLFIAWR